MPRLNDLTGMRFGRLVVIGRADNDKNGSAQWHCRCDCGEKRVVRGSDLRNGHSTSCGCFQREPAAAHTECAATDAAELVQRIEDAEPGGHVIYFRGSNLAAARMKDREAEKVAATAERMQARGTVLLVQRRVEACVFEYV